MIGLPLPEERGYLEDMVTDAFVRPGKTSDVMKKIIFTES